MHVVEVRDVNHALYELLHLINEESRVENSRNGPVLVMPTPVTTVYANPMFRVLLSPVRDANPFFHLIEALWMLEGRNDVKTMAHYVKRMKDYSDNGLQLHGAYGKRWRGWFGQDQLEVTINLLKNHPNSRRAIIQMWHPTEDQFEHERMKDVPCNITCHIQIVRGHLELTVFCRSNDLIWGATGANAVHFSILQEYLAANLSVPMGRMYQISSNLHVYKNVFDELTSKNYKDVTSINTPADVIVNNAETFDKELHSFFEWHDMFLRVPQQISLQRGLAHLTLARSLEKWHNPVFPGIALPMAVAYKIFRRGNDSGRYTDMLEILKSTGDSQWMTAAREWTQRKLDKAGEK